MSAHRTHYFPNNPPTPIAPGHFERVPGPYVYRPTGLLFIAALGAITVGVGALIALVLHVGLPSRAQAAPVRAAQLQAFPDHDDPARLAEITDAFHAGYEAGQQFGCLPPLSSPIADRQP